VSSTTVSRFCRRLGAGGYRQFKIALARDLGSPENLMYVELQPGDTLASVAQKTFAVNIQALHDTHKILDLAVLEQVVEAVCELAAQAFTPPAARASPPVSCTSSACNWALTPTLSWTPRCKSYRPPL
jgi:DNA-binding MurR/RpiR family transcriptional regulator